MRAVDGQTCIYRCTGATPCWYYPGDDIGNEFVYPENPKRIPRNQPSIVRFVTEAFTESQRTKKNERRGFDHPPAGASSSFKERIASYGVTVFSIDFGEPVRLDEGTSRPVHSVRSSSARRITESIRRAEACSLPGEGVLAFEGKISRSCSFSKIGLRARSGLRKNSLPRIRANVQPMRSRTLWRSRSSGSFSSG